MSSRYRHVHWKDMAIGDWVIGTLERPFRRVETKRGHYYLGELVEVDGRSVGFTLPVMLEQQLLGLSLGSSVRIKFLGSQMTSLGYSMWRFDVTIWPPVAPKPEAPEQT
jgi:hypothetical protein